jgi:hypothetical protein
MKGLFAFICMALSLSSAALAQSRKDAFNVNPEECGLSSSRANRLVSSKNASANSWPWDVLIYRKYNASTSYYSSGSLINSQWVLTRTFETEFVTQTLLNIIHEI